MAAMTDDKKQAPPDALLLMGTHCPYCPTVLKGLQSLATSGIIGNIETVNIEEQPEIARKLGVRSVPWVRIGPFELDGLRSEAELRAWAEKAGTTEGLADWLDELLGSGKLDKVRAQLEHDTRVLDALLLLFSNPDTGLNTRIGISVLIEDLEGTPLLREQIDRLGELAQHPETHIRGDACHYLSLTGSPRAKSLIEPLLDDPEQDIRTLAQESLEHLDSTIRH
jgi:thiol-disulfide isomerase/thioredoxin